MVPDILFIWVPQKYIVIFKRSVCGTVLKRDIVEFVSRCPNCQQVKAKYERSGGLTQVVNVPTLKWEDVNMDFVVGLPQTRRQNDSIWVIVDRLKKSTLSPSSLPIRRRIIQEYTLMRM